MKLLSLFSGIGAFEKALDYLHIKYELVNYCEIDKYASKAYSLIHNVPESMNLRDVTKIDTSKLPKDIDLITYGFPCQDISIGGKQKGFEHNGELTRSGLFFEALRIIEDCKPKIAIAENVKNLVSKRFTKEFEIVLNSLEAAGYNNYYQVLNAKDYGIPQNRERVFIVSIRKDVDDGLFHFPVPFELKLNVLDLLEEHPNEKYFKLTESQQSIFTSEGNVKRYLNSDVVDEFKVGQVADISFRNGYGHGKRTFDVCPTINTTTSRSDFVVKVSQEPLVIRKLTPLEYWRLNGFEDEDYYKAAKSLSDIQLVIRAGNSIVVDVLEEIFVELLNLRYVDLAA